MFIVLVVVVVPVCMSIASGLRRRSTSTSPILTLSLTLTKETMIRQETSISGCRPLSPRLAGAASVVGYAAVVGSTSAIFAGKVFLGFPLIEAVEGGESKNFEEHRVLVIP